MPTGPSPRSAATASVDRPAAIGIDPDRHRRSGERPYRGQPTGVVADPDLDLDAAKPGLPRLRGGGGGAGAVGHRQAGIDLDGFRRADTEQMPHRQAGAATLEVPQRQVDGGHRLGQDRNPRAGGQDRRPRAVRGHPGENLAAVLQGRDDVLATDAVIGAQRRRLPIPGDSVLAGQRDQDQRASVDGAVSGHHGRAHARL